MKENEMGGTRIRHGEEEKTCWPVILVLKPEGKRPFGKQA
jgi:hypothetical protein